MVRFRQVCDAGYICNQPIDNSSLVKQIKVQCHNYLALSSYSSHLPSTSSVYRSCSCHNATGPRSVGILWPYGIVFPSSGYIDPLLSLSPQSWHFMSVSWNQLSKQYMSRTFERHFLFSVIYSGFYFIPTHSFCMTCI